MDISKIFGEHQILYQGCGGGGNISNFPEEDLYWGVAGEGTSVNLLKRISILILYILKKLF